MHLLILKLEVVRDILLESSQSEERLSALINSSIYLKVYFFCIFFIPIPVTFYIGVFFFLHCLCLLLNAVDKHRPDSLL